MLLFIDVLFYIIDKSLPEGASPGDWNFDHPAALDLDMLATHLNELRAGKDVKVPHYCFKTHCRLPEADNSITLISSRHTDVVIVDGIFMLYSDAIRNACDVTLFTVEDLDVSCLFYYIYFWMYIFIYHLLLLL